MIKVTTMMSDTVRTVTLVTLTSLGAILAIFLITCGSIGLTLLLKAFLAFIIRIIATLGEIGIAVVAAITSGFTVSLTVILSAGVSAFTFPPSRIEARLVVAAAVATGAIFTSSVALVTMTTLHVDFELGIAVVTAAAFAVAFASVWAVGVMSLVEHETQQVGLKMTSLLQAVRHNKYHVLDLLVRLPFGRHDGESDTALLYAVKAGFVECVRVLISAGANPNIQDPYDNTPLIAACQIGSLDIVRMLLDAGAVINFQNGNRETALHHSAKWGQEACTHLLISNGADPRVQDALWRTPLMLAVRHAKTPYSIIRTLLDAGCHVNALGSEHRTALHYAAVRGIDIDRLLRSNADITVQDAEGNSPLHLASLEGHADVMKALLEAGADINIANYIRRTSIHLAASHGSLECIDLLAAHRSDLVAVDSSGHLPINYAILNNKQQATMYFVGRNCYSGSGKSIRNELNIPLVNPLKTALNKSVYHLARLLVLSGCDKRPLYESNLSIARKAWYDDVQTVHYIWLQSAIQEPWPLSDICRATIRCRLQDPFRDVHWLPLPKQIKQFLLLQDLDDILSLSKVS